MIIYSPNILVMNSTHTKTINLSVPACLFMKHHRTGVAYMRTSSTAKTVIQGMRSTHTGAVDLTASAAFLMLSFPAAVAENNRIDDAAIVRKRIVLTAIFAHKLSGVHLHGLQEIYNVRTVPATSCAYKLSRAYLQRPWDSHNLSPVLATQLAKNSQVHGSNVLGKFMV